LSWIFGSAGISTDKSEVRFHLAYITRQENKIDPELTELIGRIEKGVAPIE